MKVIGITGGVGAGKSEILSYLDKHVRCKVMIADKMAHELEAPGEICYKRIVQLLGEDILCEDNTIDKKKMAEKIFADRSMLAQINAIVHPAVRESILKTIEAEKVRGELDYLFLEAALLIECGYKEVVDEMWYIHASINVRRERLKESRSYSDEKIDSILKGQLSEEEFRKNCDFVIDNSGKLEDTYKQIDKKLGDDRCQKQ